MPQSCNKPFLSFAWDNMPHQVLRCLPHSKIRAYGVIYVPLVLTISSSRCTPVALWSQNFFNGVNKQRTQWDIIDLEKHIFQERFQNFFEPKMTNTFLLASLSSQVRQVGNKSCVGIFDDVLIISLASRWKNFGLQFPFTGDASNGPVFWQGRPLHLSLFRGSFESRSVVSTHLSWSLHRCAELHFGSSWHMMSPFECFGWWHFWGVQELGKLIFFLGTYKNSLINYLIFILRQNLFQSDS